MLQQISGSVAVAKAVALCKPEVIPAFPISPQTHIVEHLSEMVKAGQLVNSPALTISLRCSTI